MKKYNVPEAEFKMLLSYITWVPPGHYYSPIVNKDYVISVKNFLYAKDKISNLINFSAPNQIKFVKSLSKYLLNCPYSFEDSQFRYNANNGWFPKADATFLYSILKYLKPNQIIEVGSGFSSVVFLDIKSNFLPNLDINLIEPDPDRLISLLREHDDKLFSLKQNIIQDIDLSYFKTLKANDILFIDSSHVSKSGSDVNYIIFEILPLLQKGVYIHFHDIFFNFEYPFEWLLEGRSWNEAYALKAFLMYNKSFEIKLFVSHLERFFSHSIPKNLLELFNNNSGSIWIKKIK